MKKRLLMLLMAFLTTTLTISTNPVSHAFAAASVEQPGASDGNVWDIQYRLKVLGYYNDPVDGVYGWGTTLAVRKFQANYGLTVDGIVAGQTLAALKKYSVNQNELDMMAHMIYAEARGESYTGQVAVGAVIMNRLKSSAFPNTISGIIFQPSAFTSTQDGQYWLTPDADAYRAAMDAVKGWDPTHGALYYFNPNTATSSWIWSRPQLITIGHHIFSA